MARRKSQPAIDPSAVFGLLAIPALLWLIHEFLRQAPLGSGPEAMLIIVGTFAAGALCPRAICHVVAVVAAGRSSGMLSAARPPQQTANVSLAKRRASDVASIGILPRLPPEALVDGAGPREHVPASTAHAGTPVRVPTHSARVGLHERGLAHAPHADMSSAAFASFCAREMVRAGWHACVTSHGPESRADIVAERSGCRVAVACAIGAHPVGYRAVQQAVASANEQGAIGVVVSASGYTAAAQHLAASNRVLLLHYRDLGALDRILARCGVSLATEPA